MQQETPQQNPQPVPQSPPPVLPSPSAAPVPPVPQGQGFYAPASQTQYAGDPTATFGQQASAASSGTITWEASEYIHNDKGGGWLISLIVVVLLAAGIAVWFGAWTFVVLILVMGVAFGVFAFRRPHTLTYSLTNEGIHIADKMYPYSDFRAFGILEDGAFYTMTFIPVRRFSPALSVYFAEADGEKIVDIVGDHLPMQDIQPDAIDNFMRRLRF